MGDSKGNAREVTVKLRPKGGEDMSLGVKTLYMFSINELAFFNGRFRCSMEIYCKESKIGGQGTSWLGGSYK